MVTDPWKSLSPRKNADHLPQILLTYGILENLARNNPMVLPKKHASVHDVAAVRQ